ncbi:MAG: GyrI-like domain-containing protein [Patescibacteria group bacterium]|jgi:hypothetical protein
MAKVDYKKEMKELYSPSTKEVAEVVVPKMNFLMIDGKGDPNTSQEYIDSIQTLYPVAYTIKFAIKKSTGLDFGVMPLEGLWWSDDMSDFTAGKKDNWQWTSMIMQPDVVTREIFEKAVADVKAKNPPAGGPASIDKIRFESYDEGQAAQIMYIGSYSEEGPTIKRIHEKILSGGGKLSGKHHEIYLSDPRKADPKKLKTVIRQPFKE